MTVDYWVKKLGLKAHPEGGYYKESFRSDEEIPARALPPRFKGNRNFSTAIYYLLGKGDFSAFHRILADETWHFYTGDPLQLLMIKHNGELEEITLGIGESQQIPQFTVKAGCWFAAKSIGEYTLCGCTVAPGFDFNDFEMGSALELKKEFPQHKEIIEAFSRD
jgi:predicted cupin superfamily sugar epimerase